MAALDLRAWQLRTERGLQADEIYASEGLSYVGIGAIAVLGLVIAAAEVGLSCGLPTWLLLAGTPVVELLRREHARRRTRTVSSEPWPTV